MCLRDKRGHCRGRARMASMSSRTTEWCESNILKSGHASRFAAATSGSPRAVGMTVPQRKLRGADRMHDGRTLGRAIGVYARVRLAQRGLWGAQVSGCEPSSNMPVLPLPSSNSTARCRLFRLSGPGFRCKMGQTAWKLNKEAHPTNPRCPPHRNGRALSTAKREAR